MFQSQSLPCYIWGRVNILEEFAAQLGAVRAIVHAHDSGVIEEPEVLRGQTWVGSMCEIEDAHVLTGLHGAAITREFIPATGTDERNAVLVSPTRSHADLVIPATLMRSLGSPPGR